MPLPPVTTNLMPMGRNAAQNQGSGQSIMPSLPPGLPPAGRAPAPQGPPMPAQGGMGAPMPQPAPAPQFEAIAQSDGSSIIMLGNQVVGFNKAPVLPKSAQQQPQGIPRALQVPM